MARPGFSLDKKFRRLAHDLDDFQAGFGRVLARGALELLWDTAYESCTDEVGDAFDVEAAAEWRGPPGRLVKALIEAGGPGKAGFIEEGGAEWWPDGKPGTYRIHDLWDHAPEYARKRAEREEEREEKGKTIKEMRAEAGRKGAAKTNAKRAANGRPPTGMSPANGAACADEQAASVSPPAGTPTPAPTPEKQDPPPTRTRARLVSPFGEADPHPLTSAVLAGLFALGLDAAPPSAAQAHRVEAAVEAVGVELATERVAERLRVGAEKPLTYHVEAIRGEKPKRRTNGDLGSEAIPWPQRLTPAEREACRQELAALHPDWTYGEAPISVPGDPSTHPVEAIRAVQAKYRAIAEARHDA